MDDAHNGATTGAAAATTTTTTTTTATQSHTPPPPANPPKPVRGLFHDYKLVGKVGEGTYGVVYKAQKGREIPRAPWFEVDGPYYAVKIPKPNPKSDLPPVSSLSNLREMKFLRELRHPNIIHLQEIIVDPKQNDFAIVFEYADYELMKIISFYKEEEKKSIPEFTLKSFLFQLLKGVNFLHENWVMHRDLKPENIFVIAGQGPRRGCCVIGDMGLARVFRSPVIPLGFVDMEVVTLWYRAPELLMGAKSYTPAIDVWSVGCIFAAMLLAKERNVVALFQGEEMKPEFDRKGPAFQSSQCECIFRIMGFPAYPGVETLDDYSRIQKWNTEKSYPKENVLKTKFDIGPEALDLLSRMLDLDPDARITCQDALKHAYFTRVHPLPGDNALDVPKSNGAVDRLSFHNQIPRALDLAERALQTVDLYERAIQSRHKFEAQQQQAQQQIQQPHKKPKTSYEDVT